MKSLKQISTESRNTIQIKGLLGVYEQVTATRMQKVRKDVEISQVFFESLSKIAEEVAIDLSSFNPQATKSALIFLSADKKLFGDIIEKTMAKFVDQARSAGEDTDIFVAGNLGASLVSLYAPDVKFTKIDIQIDEDLAGSDLLSNISSQIGEYKKVDVFYAEFKSLANQEPSSLSLSGEDVGKTGKSLNASEESVIRLNNIYEPNVAVVSEKFSREISMSILDQSVKQNQLAKYAARLMFLDGALDGIDKRIGNLNNERRRVKKKFDQKKQSERIIRVISHGR